MQLTIPAKTLRDLVRDFRGLGMRGRVLPILDHVALEATPGAGGVGGELTVRGTDLELYMVGREACTVHAPGTATVPLALLTQLADKMVTDVKLTTENLDTVMASGKSKYTLRGLNAADYPEVKRAPDAGAIRLPAGQLAEAIGATSWAVMDGEQDNYRGSVLVRNQDGRLAMYACDNFRVSRWTGESGADARFDRVIPRRGILEVAKLLKDTEAEFADVYDLGSHVGWSIGRRYLSTRALDLTYPNIDQVLPNQYAYTADVDRQALLAAVDRALIVASSLEARLMRLSFEAGTLNMNAGSKRITHGLEVLDVAYTGEPLEVRVNGAFLRDLLKAIPADTLRFNMNGPKAPVVVTAPDAEQYTALVMPINQQEEEAAA